MFTTTIIFAILASYYDYREDLDLSYEDLDVSKTPKPSKASQKLARDSTTETSSAEEENLRTVKSSQAFDWKSEQMENANLTLGRWRR